MRQLLPALALLLTAAGAAPAADTPQSPSTEVVAVIQIHGNNVTPDADVMALVGVVVGAPFTETMTAEVRRRLLDAGRFEDVDVLKRYASIADPSQVALVIIVDEHAVRVLRSDEPDPGAEPATPRVVRRRWPANTLWLPILDAEDGYGLTYGALLAWPDVTGPRSRVSMPLSWGGHRQAAVEFDRDFVRGPFSRVRAGIGIDRRRNPAFDEPDTRRRVWARVERGVTRALRLGASTGWEDVTFAEEGERAGVVGADATFDTRIDPGLPRNAVFARISWSRRDGSEAGVLHESSVEARGFLGLVGQSVLAARVEHDASNRSRPTYLRPLLGGWSNLRGFAAGAFHGDSRTIGSLELRLPMSSPLSIAKAGVSVFVDAGKAWNRGVSFDDVPLRVGAGAGVWLSATVVQAGVSVARGRGSGTRVNVSVDVTF